MVKHSQLIGSMLVLILLTASTGVAQNTAPGMDPAADRLMLQMSAFLEDLAAFGVDVENHLHILGPGEQKRHYQRRAVLYVNRPHQLRADVKGASSDYQIFIDGAAVTRYDKTAKQISTISTTGSIGSSVGQALEAFDLAAPLTDLIFKNAHDALMADASEGRYLGMTGIDGTPCHHLAFAGKEKDWQLWIEAGRRPFPRQIIITAGEGTQTFRYIARFSGSNPSLTVDDDFFNFVKQSADHTTSSPPVNPD